MSRSRGVPAAVRSDRVVLPDGVVPATILLRNGRVQAVLPYAAEVPAPYALHDVTGLVVSPGLVDSHVHINEPGRTEWEGFTTATRAAAAGGVTTLVDMPLNSIPPTTTVAALELKRAAADGQLWVDVGFWGGVTSTDTSEVGPLAAAGVCGFKVFMVESGVDEFCCVGLDGLHETLAAAARVDVPVVVHAESPGPLADAPPPHGRAYAGWEASRPPAAETEAVGAVIAAARATGGQAHILHLSAAESVALLDAARADGIRITAETCPHYLSLASEEIADGATQTKCAPPVRGAANRDALWNALGSGSIFCIVSDHSPAPPSVKSLDTGDFATAWGGIAGIQTALPVIWTQARERGHTLLDVARWQSARPAALAGLPGKGAIAEGADADLVIWDPDETFVVDAAALQHRHAVSAWHGERLHGVVHETWLRGAPVDIREPPTGALLQRGRRVP